MCVIIQSSRESPVISKRKPPSQRPERKLDETAKAIARIREEATEKKAEESKVRNAGNENRSVPVGGNLPGKLARGLKLPGPNPATSSKQPKTPV